MNTTDMNSIGDDLSVLHRVKFSIILLLQVPAIVLCILIFTFFTTHRAALKAPHNHALLILLVVIFIQLLFDMPLVLHFYFYGYVSPATATFCTWWTFFEYTIYVTGELLLATISVQRHMFIFYAHVLRVRWMRYLLHHLPLLLCLIYPMLFFLFAIILYPCDGTQWDFTKNLCGFANCYLLYDQVLGTFDLVFHNSMSMVVDLLANVTLIIRVFIQKRRAQQSHTWGQQRRMMLQLLSLSSLYTVGWLPSLLVEVVQILKDPTFLAQVQTNYFADLVYILYLFFPWMCLGFFPEVVKWIKQLCRRQRARNMVGTTQPHNMVGTTQPPNVEIRI